MESFNMLLKYRNTNYIPLKTILQTNIDQLLQTKMHVKPILTTLKNSERRVVE